MATQLFLLDTDADTHRGTNTAKLAGATSGWRPKALGTARGSGVVTSAATATVTGATAGIEVTDGTVPYEWLSPPVSADATISGTITANIWCAESSMTANVAINVVIDIVRSDSAGTIVQIVKSTRITEEALTVHTAANFTTGMTSGYASQTLNRGDRLRVRVFGDDAGTMATGFTFEAAFNGATAAADGDSYVTFTENLTFEMAPGIGSAVIVQDSSNAAQGADGNYAQSFLATGSIAAVDLYLTRTGSPADNCVVQIQSDSAGLPSGTVLASQSISAASISTTAAYVTFVIPATLTNGVTYWIVVTRSGGADGANFIRTNGNTSNLYADGQTARYTGVVWTTGGTSFVDMRFKVYAASASTAVYLTNVQSGLSSAPALVSSFTGADESPLSEGGNWARLNSNASADALKRVSNSVSGVSAPALGCDSYWTPANFGPDLEAYVTVSTATAGNAGISARVQGEAGSNTWDGYLVVGNTTNIRIQRVDNASATNLIIATVALASGDKLGIRLEGSTIQAWRQASGSSDWDLVCTAIDATYGSAGKIGLRTSNTTTFLDDFYAATDSNLFTQQAWTSRGAGVVSYLSDTDAGWVSPLLAAEWFTKQLQAVTLTGMAQANIRALESSGSANASLRCEVARVNSDGTSPTVWASWPMSANNTRTGELNTAEAAETINVSGDDLAITDGQRLRIRLYLEDMPTTAMGNAFNVQTFYNGTSAAASGDSYITFPVTLTEYVASSPGPARSGRQRRASRYLTFR